MTKLDLNSMLLEAGEVCISKNSIVTISRAFSVAKPIASLACKEKVADGDNWLSSVVVEGCEWPRMVFAKLNVFSYLYTNKITFDIRTILGEINPEDAYIHSFVQDIQQPFPVYPKVEEHLQNAYKYCARHLISRFVLNHVKKVFIVDPYSVYVRLDLLSLDDMKTVLQRSPDFTPINFEDGVTAGCSMEGDDLSVRIVDNPGIALLKEFSFDDEAFWVYIDHETPHLAGRAIQVLFSHR